MNNEERYLNKDEILNICIKEIVYEALYKSFKTNGIEGTEELIKKHFEGKRRRLMLNGYKEIILNKAI